MQLTNQGKAEHSEVDECDSNRLWRDVIWSAKVRCSSKFEQGEMCQVKSCVFWQVGF